MAHRWHILQEKQNATASDLCEFKWLSEREWNENIFQLIKNADAKKRKETEEKDLWLKKISA